MRTFSIATIPIMIALLMMACSGGGSESAPATSQAPEGDSTQATPAVVRMPSDEQTDDFFVGVLDRLGIHRSEFALAAFDAWARMENTRARWNPLATIMKATGSSDFNSVGVQNYPDSETGMEATADTLALSYYDAIKTMLQQESFDRNGVDQGLNTWSGNGAYVSNLLEEWATLYGKSAGRDAAPPSAKQVLDLLCEDEAPALDAEELVLSPQDLPQGFRLSKQESRDNRAVARIWDNPDKWLADYEAWGRVAGRKVEFTKGTLEDAIESEAAVYRTCDGARDAFRAEFNAFEGQQRSLFEALGLKVVVFEEIKESSIADESKMWHAKVSGNLLGTPVVLDWVGLAFRRGNVTASVAWTAFNVNVFRSDVIDLARSLDTRIEGVHRLALVPTPTPAPSGNNVPAPDFELALFENENHTRGAILRLSDLQGRPAVVNFWFPSCPPCVAEMPVLEASFQAHKDDGVEFIGIEFLGVDTIDDGQAFVDQLGVTYALGPDEGDAIVDYKVNSFPSTFFLDKNQNVVRRWAGPLNAEILEEIIRELLLNESELLVYRGRSLEIHLEQPVVAGSMAFVDGGGQHRVLRPKASNRQLAMVNITVVNRTSTVISLFIDAESAQIGNRRSDRINAL